MEELLDCYYRYCGKGKAIVAGEKPDWLPPGEIPTQRQWQERQRWHEKPNAIEEACAYLDCLESVPNGTYTDVAESFGVTRARVCQMLALLKKLPPEITDVIASTEDDRFRAFFTERRLRSVAVLETVPEKATRLGELKEQLREMIFREHAEQRRALRETGLASLS